MLIQRTIIAVTFSVFISLFSFSQKLHILNAGSKASFRGLSVVNDRVAWVSGSNGVVGRTTDGGENWNNISAQGFHVCRRAKKGKAVFLAGSNGRLAKLEW